MGIKDDFQPVGDADWPSEIEELRAGFAGELNVYRTMAHHPALLAAWTALREHIVNRTSLGPELSEVVILRAGLRLQSEYEWSHHVVRARAKGFGDDRIRSVAGPVEGMEPLDALIAGSVDALLDDHALSEAQISGLVQALGKEAVYDLLATVGFYSVLAYSLNSFDVPLDGHIAEALRRDPIAQG